MAERKFEEIVRLMDTDLDGTKSLDMALREIKGINFRLSRAILSAAGVDPKQKLKETSEEQIRNLEAAIKDPVKVGIPTWMLNRRKDLDTGMDIHIVATDLDFARKSDIDRAKKLRTWKGVRHMLGQPVRGQSTRSSFRVSGLVVGVSRKAVKAAAAPAERAAAPGAAIPAAGKAPAAAPTAAKPATTGKEVKPAAKPAPVAKAAKPEAKK